MTRSLPARIRWWWAGDRVHRHVVVESSVMGRAAVINTITAAALGGGVLQLASASGSHLISTWGGQPLDITWSLALLVAAVLVWASVFRGNDIDGAVLELGAIALFVLATAAYGVALWVQGDPRNAGFVLALTYAAASNSTGRALLLWRRMRSLTKAVR